MKKISKPSKVSLGPPSPLVKGQLWQVEERLLKIGHVGPLLVHHRTVDPMLKRVSRESFTAIKALQDFLKKNKAVLVENP